ncbi:hypothetical protein ACFFRR_005051 [Megaselia abdita]
MENQGIFLKTWPLKKPKNNPNPQRNRLKFQPLNEQCQKFNESKISARRSLPFQENRLPVKNSISKKFRFPLLINQIKRAKVKSETKIHNQTHLDSSLNQSSKFTEDIKNIYSNSLSKFIDSSSEEMTICEVKPTNLTASSRNFDFFKPRNKSPLVKDLQQILGDAKTEALFKSLDKCRGSMEVKCFRGKIVQIDECYGVRVVTVIDPEGKTKCIPERCFANVGPYKRELTVGSYVEGFFDSNESLFVYEVNKIFVS